MSAEGFEAEIVSSEDPMVPWVHYITWAEKTDGVPRNAGRILRERCANAYITSERCVFPLTTYLSARRESDAPFSRYRNDERYARVWLWLASAYEAEEPGSSGPLVFERLKEARVGAELALFWVAWAFIAEKARDFAQADALFASGTLAGARPQDMLARRRAEFERRLASSQRSGRATDRGHRRAPPSHGAPQPSRAPVPPSSSGSTMRVAGVRGGASTGAAQDRPLGRLPSSTSGGPALRRARRRHLRRARAASESRPHARRRKFSRV
ncbi:hypothetical protein M885DRAFT_147390 [Pelagophyceae sp. CCMP2097]|nr:hypothetical protein M885DRAFT_147390 [Pelagophyceae sp. CCMP2097]